MMLPCVAPNALLSVLGYSPQTQWHVQCAIVTAVFFSGLTTLSFLSFVGPFCFFSSIQQFLLSLRYMPVQRTVFPFRLRISFAFSSLKTSSGTPCNFDSNIFMLSFSLIKDFSSAGYGSTKVQFI